MTYTTDQLDLLAAIRDQPDDDILRLAYADHLDGLDTVSVKCKECRGFGYFHKNGTDDNDDCPTCKCTGFVPGTSNADRAEFIRVQCALAGMPSECDRTFCDGQLVVCETCRKWKAARKREKELRTANEAAWRRGLVCGKCGGRRVIGRENGNVREAILPCPDCDGTGDLGGLMRKMVYGEEGGTQLAKLVNVTYHRGMKRVECRAEDVWELIKKPCPRCGNLNSWSSPNCPCRKGGTPQKVVKWEPTPWALAVCRHHPDCTELWITDAVIHPSGENGTYYVGNLGMFPKEYWRELDNHRSENAARTALARGIVRWVHNYLKTA